MSHSTVLMRRETVKNVGGYRAGFEPAEDFDLWLRLAERGLLANLPDVLVRYRLHHQSLTNTGQVRQAVNARRAAREACIRRKLPEPAELHPELLPAAPSPAAQRRFWARMALHDCNYRGAVRLAAKALGADVLSGAGWATLALTLAGPFGRLLLSSRRPPKSR